MRREITSFGTLLNTLRPEVYHHLDFEQLRFRDSWHARGFYERAAMVCHRARGTPLKQLISIPTRGQRWRIDGAGTNPTFFQVTPPRTGTGQRRTG